jgi:tryptophan synthase beta chain
MNEVESLGKGDQLEEHAATMTYGQEAVIHGINTPCLIGHDKNPAKAHSVASGLDFPVVGPEHAHLKETRRVQCHAVSDKDYIDAFFELSKKEGIIPAL